MSSKNPLPGDPAKRIKDSPVDLKQAEYLISRARTDLSTATRHQCIYDPGPVRCTEKEIEDAKAVAEEFLAIVAKRIRDQNPQKEFHFQFLEI